MSSPDFIYQNIGSLSGIGAAYTKKLSKLGIETVKDLLYYFPRAHRDLSRPTPIGKLQLRIDAEIVIGARVADIQQRRSRRDMVVTTVLLEDDTGSIAAVWFNQPFLARTLRRNESYVFYGRLKYSFGGVGWQLVAPSFERTPKINAIYVESGLTSKQLRLIFGKVVPHIKGRIDDPLPTAILKKFKLIPLDEALTAIHTPRDWQELTDAKERLGFDEMLNLVIGFQELSEDWRDARGYEIDVDEKLLRRFVSSLPFKLTDDQRRAAWRILSAMRHEAARPANCLLNGDVGSGKTVVAFLASLAVIKTGYSTVWLAPTEILAQQHYNTVKKLTAGLGIDVELVTGATKKSNKLQTKSEIPNLNSPLSIIHSQLFIGTHALLYRDTLGQHKVGLVVVDEQHRFGVEQRNALLHRKDGAMPHFLAMTATPIPRTMAMLLGSAVELVNLKEKPKNRQPITTKIVSDHSLSTPPTPPLDKGRKGGVITAEVEKDATAIDRDTVYRFITDQISKDRQVFVVVPLIEPSESTQTTLFSGERKALTDEAKKLQKVFDKARIATLHGKMKKIEAQGVMERFLRHEIDILVSTSIVEVGVDVPNATVMLVESADCFGLAQLHQFRGRVGRGEHPSYCFLATAEGALQNPKTKARLQVLADTDDGFIIAQKDLELRGPGNVLGVEQSGFLGLRLASLSDTLLVEKAKEALVLLGTAEKNKLLQWYPRRG